MDNTHELVARYLNGGSGTRNFDTDPFKKTGKAGPESLSHSSMNRLPDLDVINDPLDDDLRFGLGKTRTLPTPRSSPQKSGYIRLRGSPVKFGSRASAQRFDDDTFHDWVDIDARETHKALPSDVLPPTKEFQQYKSLLSLSTERLIQQLRAEQVHVAHLQQQVEALKNEKFNKEVLQQDHEITVQELKQIKQQKQLLEQQLSEMQLVNREPELRRENNALRAKLKKYKTLYEDLRRSSPDSWEQARETKGPSKARATMAQESLLPEQLRDNHPFESKIPKGLAAEERYLGREQPPAFGSGLNFKSPESQREQGGKTELKSKENQDLIALVATLQQTLSSIKAGEDRSEQSPSQSNEIKKVIGAIDTIQRDMHNVITTLKGESCQCGLKTKLAAEPGTPCPTDRAPKATGTSGHMCETCARNKASIDESTPDRDNNTQELMGKYLWNRTL